MKTLVRDRKYLDSLRNERCIITGLYGTEHDPVEAAHLRLARTGGTGMKPPDNHALPLRHSLHQKQHMMPEMQFWRENISDDCLREALIALAEKIHRTHKQY